MTIVRLFKIIRIFLKYGLEDLFDFRSVGRIRYIFVMLRLIPYGGHAGRLAKRFRLALEELGPIFIKFGQLLSTRRDILALEFADELSVLQDKVPPFGGDEAIRTIEQSLRRPLNEIFSSFQKEAVASASIAQVHKAVLLENRTVVAVKVLRPNLKQTIQSDLRLMRRIMMFLKIIFKDVKRLKPQEVMDEFDRSLNEELDLMHEAANASQLRRNFCGSKILTIPEVYFDYCNREVMVMQWQDGIPIGDIDELKANRVDLTELGKMGVEIFFTQVFKHGFFHADMHPGNILVDPDYHNYIALDFGIVGTLTDYDKHYLAVNFLAFFNRDYNLVAKAHIESGWAPKGTRIQELEAAVRTVCEPIFERPLSQISFGIVLMRLFETSARFNIEIQPQLVLLQKTLLNIEGLGRQLDPNLDLWETARPFLVRWMQKEVGPQAFLNSFLDESKHWFKEIPKFPRLLSSTIQNIEKQNEQLNQKLIRFESQNRTLQIILAILLILVLFK